MIIQSILFLVIFHTVSVMMNGMCFIITPTQHFSALASHRAQRISVVYDKRHDEENAKKWQGWRLGNLRPVFEPILCFVKPYKLGSTITDNVIQNEVGAFNDAAWATYANASSNTIKVKSKKNDHGFHPAQKPLSLLEALIELTTLDNHIVLDPFCGSGSTLVAAKKLNRRYIGIEQNKDYCDVSKKRLEETSIYKEKTSLVKIIFRKCLCLTRHKGESAQDQPS